MRGSSKNNRGLGFRGSSKHDSGLGVLGLGPGQSDPLKFYIGGFFGPDKS